jgi:hypothetical protein
MSLSGYVDTLYLLEAGRIVRIWLVRGSIADIAILTTL